MSTQCFELFLCLLFLKMYQLKKILIPEIYFRSGKFYSQLKRNAHDLLTLLPCGSVVSYGFCGLPQPFPIMTRPQISMCSKDYLIIPLRILVLNFNRWHWQPLFQFGVLIPGHMGLKLFVFIAFVHLFFTFTVERFERGCVSKFTLLYSSRSLKSMFYFQTLF